MDAGLEVWGFCFSPSSLYLTFVGSCFVVLQLDVSGVQVTWTLSSKFEKECKLVSKY